MKKNKQWIIWGALLIVIIAFPQVFGIYYTNVVVGFAIFALYTVTLNLLLGYTGLLSFGHAVFFGTGGYATALVLAHIKGFPLIPSLLIGMLAGGGSALILSPLLVRVRETAFAMLTLSFGMLMHMVCLKLRVFTGGEDGVGGFDIPPLRVPGLFSIDITHPFSFFYFAVFITIISIWAIRFFTRTPFGSIMVAIRDNPRRVDYMGFKVPNSKALILVVSGAFAGLAGSLYALFQNLVSADGVYGIMISFNPIIATVVGGMGSFFGPIVGAGVLTIMEEVANRFTERIDLVFGILLVFTVMVSPMGIMGSIQLARARKAKQKEAA